MIINIVLFLCVVYPSVIKDVQCEGSSYVTKIVYRRPHVKFDNPNYMKDRDLEEIWKPMMDDSWKDRFKQPFSPVFMDYCDPYHCNAYSKPTCGLDRGNKRYKWFQSWCHLGLSNMCRDFRGTPEYETVDPKYCYAYVLKLREGCSTECPAITDAICAVSLVDNHVAMFKNRCIFERENCKGPLEEYEEIYPEICLQLIGKKIVN